MKTEYTFFWSGPFSNWSRTKFTYNGVEFSSSEQAMMWVKAMVFTDPETATKILSTTDPKKQKQYGREVVGYVDEVWAEVREELVYDICLEKFKQDIPKQQELLATGNTILVEASPVDRIWGIGLAADNPLAQNEATWKGLNLLGKVLTRVREKIKCQ